MGELMADGNKLTQEDFASFVAPKTTEDYENMPWLEVGSRGIRNLPGSVYEAGKGIVEAVTSPIETTKALANVGYGLGSMAYGALGGEQDPAKKAENEALARAVVEPYTSVGAFKKELAENPAGPLSLALPAAGGALVKTGEAIGTAGRIGSTLSKLGRGVEAASSAVDPARAALETASAVKNYGPRAAAIAQHLATGSPESVFEQAFKAGAERGVDADAIRAGFNDFYNGNGDVVGLSQDIEKAVDAIRNKESSDWIATRGKVTGASTTPIDYTGVQNAFADAWKNYGGHPRGKTSAFPQERAALSDAARLVREYNRSVSGAGKNNLAGLDELKRALWARAQNSTGGAQDAYKKIHAAVRQTLENTSSEYAALMDRYQTFLDEMTTIKRTMGAGQNVDANAQLSRAMRRGFETPGGQAVMERIASVDPTIPYKIAGASLSQSPTGLRQVIAGSATAGPAIANAIASGDPIQIAKVIPFFVAGAAASSPRIMGKGSYLAGRAAAGVKAAGDIPLGPITTGDVASTAEKAAYPAALASEQLQFGKNRISDENKGLVFSNGKTLNIREPQNTGGRVARKSGGRIKSSPISAEVRKVRALLSEKTASMLSVPDDAIATALHIAKGK